MENTQEQKFDKINKFGVLDWTILVVVIFTLPGSIMLFLGDIFSGWTVIIPDIIWFILSVWGFKIELKKFKSLKTQKSYNIVLIISWIIAIIVLGSAFLSIIFSFTSHTP